MFKKGTRVRIGKGKVEYTVLSDQTTDTVDIESTNTGKAQTIAASRLVLIEDVVLSDAQIEELDETYAEHGMPAAQEKKAAFVFAGEFVPDDTATIEQYRHMVAKVGTGRPRKRPLKLQRGKRGGKLRVAR